MSIELPSYIEERLKKNKRKWRPAAQQNNSDYIQKVELCCTKCGKSLRVYDINLLARMDLQTHVYCNDCLQQYIKPTPYEFEEGIVIEDRGDMVIMRRKDDLYGETTVWKTCYFNTKGRFIKRDGKRYYI